MGKNGQAMLSVSSSAEEADEGVGMSRGFPFVVLSGGDAAKGSSVNPAFVAYAKRVVAPGRSAREALVLALAEADSVEATSVSRGEAARVDETSYGVTRSPFASVTTPAAVVPAVKAESVSSAEVVKKEGAARRRPVLRTGGASEPNAVGVTPASVPTPAAAPVPTPVSQEAASPAAEPASGKVKISLRRAGPASGPAPGAGLAPPPTDAPFFFGPVMDGSRAPLVPLPVASGEPGGAFVSPAHVSTRSPFPVAGGALVGAVGAGLAPLTTPRPATGAVVAGRRVASRTAERDVGFLRVALVGVVLVVLGGGVYFARQSPYWPFRLKQAAVAGEASPGGESRAAVAEARGEAQTQAFARTTSASVFVAPHPTRPAPGAGFIGLLERLRITGVLQGEPVRAIIDGRLVQAGDLVDVARGVRLVGLDVIGRQLIFEDGTTAQANVRY